MKTIAPRRQIEAELVARWRGISASTLGHLTCDGFLDGLRPQAENRRLLGNVVTVKVFLPDGAIIRDALLLSQPGDVLVIECAGESKYACWGELRTLAAMVKGLAGVVVGGRVTDIAALRREALAVFSEGVSAVTTCPGSNPGGSVNLPVRVAGVDVEPGSLAIGDDDGVFILSPSRAAQLAPLVAEKERQDAVRRREMLMRLQR